MSQIRIRRIDEPDVKPGLELVHRVFDELVAPDFGPAGAASFAEWAEPVAFSGRMRQGHLGLVAVRDDRIVGLLEWMPPDHLAMLFVDPAFQGKGIGRRLFEEALGRIRSARGEVTTVSVNAARHALPFYRRLGFREEGPERESNGIVYTPMRLEVEAGS